MYNITFSSKTDYGQIKPHAICLPRGPNFNDININKLVKSIDYLTVYLYAFRFGDSSTVFHKLWSVRALKYYQNV